jgi:hypothetical protein
MTSKINKKKLVVKGKKVYWLPRCICVMQRKGKKFHLQRRKLPMINRPDPKSGKNLPVDKTYWSTDG